MTDLSADSDPERDDVPPGGQHDDIDERAFDDLTTLLAAVPTAAAETRSTHLAAAMAAYDGLDLGGGGAGPTPAQAAPDELAARREGSARRRRVPRVLAAVVAAALVVVVVGVGLRLTNSNGSQEDAMVATADRDAEATNQEIGTAAGDSAAKSATPSSLNAEFGAGAATEDAVSAPAPEAAQTTAAPQVTDLGVVADDAGLVAAIDGYRTPESPVTTVVRRADDRCAAVVASLPPLRWSAVLAGEDVIAAQTSFPPGPSESSSVAGRLTVIRLKDCTSHTA